jgi:predicted DNA-binding transcriptional regulator AlpA
MTNYEIERLSELLAEPLAEQVYKLLESNAFFPDRFMNISECSRFTSIPIGTLYQLVSKKRIPFIKKCRRLIFSERKICQWLNGTLEVL